ncbi:MAG TPA: RsmE family RNA methyltransferase [Spirochaetota bacterium]|nr:RsmE family RNA methyltransferase [Spirochaetota bacterium]
MTQVFVTERYGNRFIIKGDDYHHIARVRRVKINDIINVRDPEGSLVRARVTRIDAAELEAIPLEEKSPGEGAGGISLILAVAVLKGKKFDFVIQKATEAGVDQIIPVITERTVPDISGKAEPRLHRWNRIAEEASKQCMKGRVTAVGPFESFNEYTSRQHSGEKLLAHPDSATPLSEYHRCTAEVSCINLLVGPEGGFSSAEVDRARASGWTPVRVGSTVFRAETAAVVIPSIVLYEWSRG